MQQGSGGGGGGGPSPSCGSPAGGKSGAAEAPPAVMLASGQRARLPEESPMRKLTTGLLASYKAINSKYYAAKKARQEAAAKAGSSTNAASDYVMTAGDILGGRYKVTESIGKGSFGQVVSAEDIREGPTLGRKVAVKVIKAREAFRKQAKTEIKLLEALNAKDSENQWCIVRFFESFDHNGHTCLVFEHLSFNLYELLRRTHFKGVSLTLIRKFARQVLKTLAFLRLPEVDIVHCDLKPENILFCAPQRSAVKVIDFGSSCPRSAPMYKYIQSRFYRSPEVILELPYDGAIDMWSMGVIIVEMHTGLPLFGGRDEKEQMRRFVTLLGLPPRWMLQASKKTEQFFEVTRPEGEALPTAPVAPARVAAGAVSRRSMLPPPAGAAAPWPAVAHDVDGVPFDPLSFSAWEKPSAGGVGALGAYVEGADDRPGAAGFATFLSAYVAAQVGLPLPVEPPHSPDAAAWSEDEERGTADTPMAESLRAIVLDDGATAGGALPAGSRRRRGGAAGGSDGCTLRGGAAGGSDGGTPGSDTGASEGFAPAAAANAAATNGAGALPEGGGGGGGGGGGAPAEGRRPRLRRRTEIFLDEPPPLPPSLAYVIREKLEDLRMGGEGGDGTSSKSTPPMHRDLREVLGAYTGGPGGRRRSEKTGHSVSNYLQLVDLVTRMLDMDPKTRITPLEALNHPFLRSDIEESEAAVAAQAASGGGGGGGGSGTQPPATGSYLGSPRAPP